MKQCSRCGQAKSLDQFPPRSDRPDGRASACRECDRARQREYYAANRERLAPGKAARAAEWYEINKTTHVANVVARRKAKRTNPT